MLTHLTHSERGPDSPTRLVVLGAGGFIGGAIVRRARADGLPLLELGRPGLDLLAAGAGERLAALLDAADTLVFVSALAPVRNLAMLQDNLRMAQAVCEALAAKPVAHLVYVSSDAVYKDSASPLHEASCAEPGSLHGVMHLAREVALRQAHPGPFAIVRPTLVYGFDDPHNGYGPNRFRRLAAAGKDIPLFGEGEERRDHVDVADVAELVHQIVMRRSVGIANAVSGDTVSFRELAEFTAKAFVPAVAVTGSPRVGPMPHDGYRPFDNRAVLAALPGFRFRTWREGVADAILRQQRAGDA